MGYTHHFENIELNDDVIKDVKEIIRRSPVSLTGFKGKGRPDVKKHEIRFNYTGADKSECFILRNGTKRLVFKQTDNEAYNTIVAVCLISLLNNDALGWLKSDSRYSEWEDALRFYEKVCGKVDKTTHEKLRKVLR